MKITDVQGLDESRLEVEKLLATVDVERWGARAAKMSGVSMPSLDESDMATSASAVKDGKGTSLRCLGACARGSALRFGATYVAAPRAHRLRVLRVVVVVLALEGHGRQRSIPGRRGNGLIGCGVVVVRRKDVRGEKPA
jgi:hypothetical protein